MMAEAVNSPLCSPCVVDAGDWSRVGDGNDVLCSPRAPRAAGSLRGSRVDGPLRPSLLLVHNTLIWVRKNFQSGSHVCFR